VFLLIHLHGRITLAFVSEDSLAFLLSICYGTGFCIREQGEIGSCSETSYGSEDQVHDYMAKCANSELHVHYRW